MPPLPAFVNEKFTLVLHKFGLTPLQRGDAGKRRHTIRKRGEKFQRGLLSLHFDAHALGRVAHASREPELRRLPIDEGSEPHALNLARDRVDVPFPHAILRRAV